VADKLNPCRWCGKRNRTASDWEQESLKRGWQRLCVACANKRLKNPYNALLPMRKANLTPRL
jgi:hypothetical protein